jgi:DNA polymerase-3 subunit epsilon
VAHNAGFDYSFLRREFKTLGINFRRKKLCTVRLSRRIIPGLHSYSLGTLCASLGIKIEDRHRASGDAKATVKLLKYLINRDSQQHLEEALSRFSREGTLPPNLPKDEFEQLPEDVGVYYFMDRKGKVIYVGKAKNIRSRVLTHFQQFSNSNRSLEFRNQICSVSHELCGNELIAYLLESHEIKKYWPRFNRSQRFTRYCWGIYQYFDQNGYARLTVGRARKSDKPLISFKSFDQTWDFIRRQAEQYSLCKRLCNIQTVSGSCLDFSSGDCSGACIQQESTSVYNQRVQQCLANFRHLDNSYFLLGKGRSECETSLVWVENGKYRGFGFVDNTIQESELDGLIQSVKPYADNQDVQRIISTYLNSHPNCRRIMLHHQTVL